MHKRTTSSFSIIIIVMLLCLLGSVFIADLKLALLPNRTLPSITISYSLPHTSAKVLENNVTKKIESVVEKMQGVAETSSFTSKGHGHVRVKFDKESPMDIARFNVSTAIRELYAKLPDNLSYPVIDVNKPGEDQKPLLNYVLFGRLSSPELTHIAEQVFVPQISQLAGVSHVEVYGKQKKEYIIEYEPRKLQNLNVEIADISESIKNHLNSEYIGFAKNSSNQLTGRVPIKTGLNSNDFPDWANIVIENSKWYLIKLGQIANVHFKLPPRNKYYRINGLETIGLTIYPVKNANNIKVGSKVKRTISKILSKYDATISHQVVYDATKFIKKELNKILWRTLIALFSLLVFVLLLTRSFRYLLIITITLVANLLIAIIFYQLLGVEIHIYSLAGITISMGVIIDNCIIMVDHIRHHQNRNVILPIVAASLTTIGALSIILFLNYETQISLIDFSYVIIINLSVSLMLSLWFVPALIDYLPVNKLKNRSGQKRYRTIIHINRLYLNWITVQNKSRWIFIVALVVLFGLPVHKLPQKIEKDTGPAALYNATIGSNFYQAHLKKYVELGLGGTYRLFSKYVFTDSYTSEPGKTVLSIHCEGKDGTTIQQINKNLQLVESFLSGFNEIESFTTNIERSNKGSIRVLFSEAVSKTSFPFQLKNKIIEFVDKIGGVDWGVVGVGRGFSNAINEGYNSSNIYLYGYNYNDLYYYAMAYSDKINQNRRVKDLKIKGSGSFFTDISRKKWLMGFDADYLSVIDFNISNIYKAVQLKSGKMFPVTHILQNGQLHKVSLKPTNEQSTIWEIQNKPVFKNNQYSKLSGYSTIYEQYVGHDIHKKNQQYQIVIGFNFAGTAMLEKKFVRETVSHINSELPMGYKADLPGYGSFFQKRSNYSWAILAVLFLLFIILSVLLESIKKPIAIIALTFVAFSGIFLTFYWFDINFDQGGYASFILIAGISINASLYILNEYNVIAKIRNFDNKQIYIKAFSNKIIPILLTVISTILALLPFIIYAKEEPFWYAFAAGSIGGLTFSIIGLIIWLPAMVLKNRSKSM